MTECAKIDITKVTHLLQYMQISNLQVRDPSVCFNAIKHGQFLLASAAIGRQTRREPDTACSFIATR